MKKVFVIILFTSPWNINHSYKFLPNSNENSTQIEHNRKDVFILNYDITEARNK